jgi:hypothetical protein
MSATNSRPTETRCSVIASAITARSRRSFALVTVISLAMPPGWSSISSTCSRQAALLRRRPRSRCRLIDSFNTWAWLSALTQPSSSVRSAVIATERASFGSFFCGLIPTIGCASTTPSGRQRRFRQRRRVVGQAGSASLSLAIATHRCPTGFHRSSLVTQLTIRCRGCCCCRRSSTLANRTIPL